MLDDEVTQLLFEWATEIRNEREADVVVVDFRDRSYVRAALIGVKKAFSLGALVPQLIAIAFNVRRASDIESAVETSGVPCAFVRRKFFVHSGTRPENTFTVPQGREMVATVVTDDGKAEGFATATNHEIARTLSRIAKRPVVYVDVPENIARQSMRQLGMPASLIEVLLQHGSVRATVPESMR